MAEQPTPFATLRGLLTGSARGQAPTTAPVVTAGAAQTAPVLPQQPVQQETSLLEQLRERVQRDISPGPMSGPERLAAFGRGVLSNRGSFLDNLTAGLAAQGQAEAARREEGRKAAELEATIAERDRRAQLDKAKFAEETSPESLSGRYREAQIANLRAQAAQAGRSNLQIVGRDEATGYAIAMDPRTGETRVLTGVRPTRVDVAEITARGQARRMAEQAADRDVQALQREIQQGIRHTPTEGMETYREGRILFHEQRLLGEPSGSRGPQQPPPPTEGGAAGNVVNLPRL